MGYRKILDCTLRDGGYCNGWRFGQGNARAITAALVSANVDIVELGFLTKEVRYDPDVTRYTELSQMGAMIPGDRAGKRFVCMINYGEYPLEELPDYDGTSVDGIRVAFHKCDRWEALRFCEGIQNKGYKVFVQAMVATSYTDGEYLDLIRRCNALGPHAFYIVDSFGVMKRRDLLRLFHIVEENLAEGIAIGYHGHDNMQMACSNARALAELPTERDLIIDASVSGMGRGAGNLHTELFAEYLNENLGGSYRLEPLLGIIDRILNRFYRRAPWGYSPGNSLCARYGAHPGYAAWLEGKKLTEEEMERILAWMEPDKRLRFDGAYIEALYLRSVTEPKFVRIGT